MTKHLNVWCVVYLEVLVIAEYLDNTILPFLKNYQK